MHRGRTLNLIMVSTMESIYGCPVLSFFIFFLTYLDGWIYTNDTWMDPRSAPAEEWITSGVTRRRRWTRRIYRTQDAS